MSVPPIPDEAWEAAEESADAFTHEGHPQCEEYDGNCYRCLHASQYAVTAAWPHLYAAALRHVAESIVVVASDHSALAQQVAGDFADGLRALADVAVA